MVKLLVELCAERIKGRVSPGLTELVQIIQTVLAELDDAVQTADLFD